MSAKCQKRTLRLIGLREIPSVAELAPTRHWPFPMLSKGVCLRMEITVLMTAAMRPLQSKTGAPEAPWSMTRRSFPSYISRRAEPASLPSSTYYTNRLLTERCHRTSFSLTRTVLDHLLNLPLHRLEVERSRVLHRRVFDCSLRQLPDVLLDYDEAPELPRKEVIHGTGRASV
jgi:hypothetical protein